MAQAVIFKQLCEHRAGLKSPSLAVGVEWCGGNMYIGSLQYVSAQPQGQTPNLTTAQNSYGIRQD